MAEQPILDLLDRDVLPTADDDGLAPTRNADVSVGIALCTVSGLQPSADGKALLGEALALNVADEGVGAAGEQVWVTTSFRELRERGLIGLRPINPRSRNSRNDVVTQTCSPAAPTPSSATFRASASPSSALPSADG